MQQLPKRNDPSHVLQRSGWGGTLQIGEQSQDEVPRVEGNGGAQAASPPSGKVSPECT